MDDAAKKRPEAPHVDRYLAPWNAHRVMGPEAVKSYKSYLTEHRKRLKQLAKEGRGETTGESWYLDE